MEGEKPYDFVLSYMLKFIFYFSTALFFAFGVSTAGKPVYRQKELFDSRVVWNHPGILGSNCPGMQPSCFIRVMKQRHADPEAIRFVQEQPSLFHLKTGPAAYPFAFKDLGRVDLTEGCYLSADLGCVWFLVNSHPLIIPAAPGKELEVNPLYKRIFSYLRSQKLLCRVEADRSFFEGKEKFLKGEKLYIFQFPFMPFACCPAPFTARVGYLFSMNGRFMERKVLTPCYNPKFQYVQGEKLDNLFHLPFCQS